MIHKVFILCLCLVTFVCARPLNAKDVYVPHVLYPIEGTVWKVGETRNVTWDTTNPPAQITNSLGSVSLRKGDMTLPTTLASDFDILLGRIEIKVPSVPPSNDYRIVLFGDSGNWSPEFTIAND